MCELGPRKTKVYWSSGSWSVKREGIKSSATPPPSVEVQVSKKPFPGYFIFLFYLSSAAIYTHCWMLRSGLWKQTRKGGFKIWVWWCSNAKKRQRYTKKEIRFATDGDDQIVSQTAKCASFTLVLIVRWFRSQKKKPIFLKILDYFGRWSFPTRPSSPISCGSRIRTEHLSTGAFNEQTTVLPRRRQVCGPRMLWSSFSDKTCE